LETIRDLKRMAPQLPILATSGDSMWAGESLTAAQRFGAACVLEKPIRSEVLLQAVADLL
ncbi:MAG: response regulator, partial [Verrucomicrobiota bacterium]